MRRNLFITAFCLGIFAACNSNPNNNEGNATSADTQNETAATTSEEQANNQKGIGKYTSVELTHPLDQKMIAQGKAVYDLKCASCHKLSDEKLVGPGWKGVTDRRQPEWIMNFVTNTEEMLQKDTAAQNMMEICLVQMPNQNLSDADARSVLEFMRNNDGKK
ncbi:MAG: c-type cytochrome [Ilyomonas sp.]